MFVDQAKVWVRAGRGGDGCISFRREKYEPNGGPNGGDGGRGGAVILRAVRGEQSLVAYRFQQHLRAANGEHGRGKGCHGANGADNVGKVPLGTMVRDFDTGELLADLTADGQEYVAARGGKGGQGNTRFATSRRRAPRISTPGEDGEEVRLLLDLKTIADVGLVGYPNAGKSTLLAAISDAHPKTAPYPFTTRHPVVGVVEFDDYSRLTIADIPGLIEGAHQNVGLGHEFLRHIERCRVLAYVLDTAGQDGRDACSDLATLQRELELHQEGLSLRPRVVIANKMDLAEARENLDTLCAGVEGEVIPVSALSGENTDRLIAEFRRLLKESMDAD